MTFDPPPTHEHPAHQSHSRRFPSFSSSSQHGQSPPAYSTKTEDILSAKYQRWSKLLNAIRIATAAIMLIIAVPIIGTTGNSLKAYQSTNLGGKMYLPLWPANVDLRPTHSILACGVVVTTWSLIYLIASFFPSVRLPPFPPTLSAFSLTIIQASPKTPPPQHPLHRLQQHSLIPHHLHHNVCIHNQRPLLRHPRRRLTHDMDMQMARLRRYRPFTFCQNLYRKYGWARSGYTAGHSRGFCCGRKLCRVVD